jgi:putative hydrolase of the HAD superfamily
MKPPFQHIKAIVFDAVGTLISPTPPASKVYEGVGQEHGSRHTEEEIRARFNQALKSEEERDRLLGFRTDEQREEERWRNIVGRVLDDVREPEAVFQQLFVHFAQPAAWELNIVIEMEPLASTLAGYRLGIASNYDRRLKTVMAGFPNLSRFEQVIISSEVGWRKPARPFFDAIAQKFQLDLSTILYVGDQIDIDYRAAVDAGMQTVLFDKMKLHSGESVSCISALQELVGLLRWP